jgi:hypothetical protein
MRVDVLVDGRVVGTATITVQIPNDLAKRHGVSAADVLRTAVTGRPQLWYCGGNISLQRASGQK